MILLALGLASATLIIINLKFFQQPRFRKVFVLGVVFITWSVFSLFGSKINLLEGLFGVTGRQTGLLTYFSLACLLIVFSASTNLLELKHASKLLLISGYVSGGYGLIQILDLDPYPWITSYTPVFGLFGNPNFQASFMGISASAALAFMLDGSESKRLRILSAAFILIAILNIYFSKSQQGYLVFLSGASLVLYLRIRGLPRLAKLSIPVAVLTIITFVAIIADILQKAPWSSILYKESVTYRGDYWRAGVNMTLSNPIFGVGPDGYRDHFRASRDLVAASRAGSDAPTDAAHNIPLDIASNGGVLLLIVYILMILLVLISGIKLIIRNQKFDSAITGALAAWIAYLAQSLISINQIGLAVWGWTLSGLIIGFEIATREKSESKTQSKSQGSTIPKASVPVFVGFVMGVALSFPVLIADGNFRSSIKSGDVLKIEESARAWPQSVVRMTNVAQILRLGNFPDRSIEMAREAVAFNPMNFEAWKELSLQPKATPQEIMEALRMMKKLDPHYSNLK